MNELQLNHYTEWLFKQIGVKKNVHASTYVNEYFKQNSKSLFKPKTIELIFESSMNSEINVREKEVISDILSNFIDETKLN